MADWTFEDALMAIQSPPSIPASVLQSMDGLRLGDICFAKIQTTLRMCTMPLTILEKWVEDGKFNPEQMAESDYSCSMAILVTLSPNAQGTALESAGIGLIICQCKAPIGQLGNIPHLIKYAHSLLEAEGQSSEPEHRTFCTIVGNYRGTWHLPWILHSVWPILWSSSLKKILLR